MKIIKERYTKPISNPFIRGNSTYPESPDIFVYQSNYYPKIQYQKINLTEEQHQTRYKEFLQIQSKVDIYNHLQDKDQLQSNSIAYIYAMDKTKKMISIGTCAVISPKLVLTSVHNVYNRKSKDFYDKIIIYFGLSHDQCCQELEVSKQNIFIPDLYKKGKPYDYDESMGNDIAIIYSNDYTLNQNCGVLPLHFNNEELQENESMLLYGYRYIQAKKGCDEETGKYDRDKLKCSIKKFTLNQKSNIFAILEGIKTQRGYIGAPILKKINEKYHIIGMHSRIIKNESKQLLLNVGTIFNTKTKALINNLVAGKQCYQPYQLIRNQKINLNFMKTLIKYDFRNLIQINFNNCSMTDQFASIICYSKFNQLLKVYFENNELTDKAVQSLGKAEWPRIQLISLLGNKIKNKNSCKRKLKADFSREHLTVLI